LIEERFRKHWAKLKKSREEFTHYLTVWMILKDYPSNYLIC
jgi:hypothetical protein